MITEQYITQLPNWPKSGQHILAQYDEDSVIVYQAYRPSIGEFAHKNQQFGGEFSYSRMSWIKTNFLWMMYRSGWGTKSGQEVTLAVRINRAFFEKILEEAVPSSFDPNKFGTRDEWKQATTSSEVRLQWDPDHDPSGEKVSRRAVQLGLRGSVLARYGQDAIVEISDISEFVDKQRQFARGNFDQLITPREAVFRPRSEKAVSNVQLSVVDV